MGLPEILKEVDRLDGESKEFKAEILKLCWFMRGGLSLDEAFSLSYEERMLIGKIIEDNLETTKKTGMPFF
jgi:hypothetical protein